MCNGSNTQADIVQALEIKFEAADLENDIVNFLTIASDNGWLTQRT